ncbi:MAG: zinc metallopeptidase [Chloroflexota bacterium]
MVLYLLISLPALILGMWAQSKVKSAFAKYSKVRTMSGMTGAQIARNLLDSSGLSDVRIEPSKGMLSDHYDPRSRTLRLSEQVYQVPSVAAAGVAAHEAGHALQHAKGYAPLQFRSAMVPSVQIGSWLGPIIFMLGLFLQPMMGSTLAYVGLGLFGLTALFAIVTLPVEYDASRRAKKQLASLGLVQNNELEGVDNVLDAAALTYVAGAVQAVSTLIYYGMLLGGGRRRR